MSVLSHCALAQKTIKGKVFDAYNNTPLFGATIKFTGKGGTTSDKDGMFSVDCSKSTEIIVSFIGYETYKQLIRNCNDAVWPAMTNIDAGRKQPPNSIHPTRLPDEVTICRTKTNRRRGAVLSARDNQHICATALLLSVPCMEADGAAVAHFRTNEYFRFSAVAPSR